MVQIPSLQKIQQTDGLAQNPRLNIQAQNSASDIINRVSSINQVAAAGADLYQKVEDGKVKQLSYEAEQEYSMWNTAKLQELKSYQGDPTDAYAQYDIDSKEKLEQIFASRGDLSETVKNRVKANLQRVVDAQNIQALKQRGAQQETYDNNLYESQVKLKRNSMAVNAGYIRKNDPSSYFMLDQTINDIKTTAAERALSKGAGEQVEEGGDHVYRNDKGEVVRVKLNPVTQQRVASEISLGLKDSISSMISAGYTQEAKEAFERYKPLMDNAAQRTITNKMSQNNFNNEALSEVSKIEALPEDRRDKEIEKIKNPEVKRKTLQYLDDNSRYRENLRRRQIQKNYEALSKNADDLLQSGQIVTLSQFEQTEQYKAMWDKLDDKTRKAITQKFNSPNKSSSKALFKVQNAFYNFEEMNKIAGMSNEEFEAEYLVDLKTSDKAKYNELRLKMMNPSNSEQRASMNFADKMIKKSLMTAKIITDSKGKENQKRIAEAQKIYLDYQESLNRALTPEETIKLSNQIASDVIRTKSTFGFGGGNFKEFKPIPAPVNNPVKKSTGEFKFESDSQRRELMKEYRKEKNVKGFVSSNDPQFKEWLRRRQG